MESYFRVLNGVLNFQDPLSVLILIYRYCIMLQPTIHEDSSLFKELENTPLAQYLDAIKSLLSNYEETSSWQRLKQILIQLKNKIKHQLIFRLLTYLMNQEAIKETYNILYQFLLFGRKMKKEKRLAFVDKKEEETLKFNLHTFIGMLGMENQPEYVLYAHLFIEEPQLSLSILNTYIPDSHIRINVQHKIKTMKDQQKKSFNLDQILAEHEMLSVLNVILPLNLTEIRLLKRQYLTVQYFRSFQDLEIFLFIGRTGIGKSTLILFSLGYEFELTTDADGWKQLAPKNLKEQHKAIVSKSSSTSVTNAIHVATTQYKGRKFGLSDTPGDGDTRGITRMFFNQLILKWETYKYFKKAKIIEVVDIQEMILGRKNNLSQFVTKIASSYNFTSYSDLQSKLTVIFNKYDPEYNSVSALVEMIQENRNKGKFQPRQEEVLTFLLSQMIDKPIDQIETVIPKGFVDHPEKRTRLLEYLLRKPTVDPEVVIKRQESKYKAAITTTQDYFYSNIKRGLQIEDYDMAYHYYLEREELIKMCPISLPPGDETSDAIKAKSVEYYNRFKEILQQGCQKIYQEKDFKELKHIREKLTHIQIFKTHILDLKTSQELAIVKEELIQSYKEKINNIRCSDEFINNYKQFLEIFNINEDPAQLLTISNQRILKDIDSIFTNNEHFSSLDELYNDLSNNTDRILSLNPNSKNNQKSNLDSRLQTIITSLFQKIKSQMQSQVLQVYGMSDLQSTLEVEPIQRELLVSTLIKEYERFEQSAVLRHIRTALESSTKISTLESLQQMLLKALLEKFKLFKKMLLSTEKAMKTEAVANLRKFMNTYKAIKFISQKISTYYEKLKKQILKNKLNSEKILLQIFILFSQFINQNENMPQFAYRASNIKRQVLKVEAYSQFLQEKYKKGDFYQKLNELIRNAHSSVPDKQKTLQLKNETIQKEIFILMIHKYTKLRIISEAFTQGAEEIEQFNRKIQEFVENLCEKIEKGITENMRQYKFMEQLKKKTYFNSLNFYGFIYQQLKAINYKNTHLQIIMKVFDEVYDKCQKLIENDITFERASTLSKHQARDQIHIQRVFHIFDFLNKIVQISVFQGHFREIDVRQEIIAKLERQITTISDHIEQRVREKSFNLQDPIYRRVYDLGQIGNDTFELLDASKTKIDSYKVVNLKTKYDALMQFALTNAQGKPMYVSLELKEHDELLQVVNKFIVLHDQQRHMPDNRKRIFNQLCNHISTLMRPYSAKSSESLIKSHYPKLINIQNRLSKDAGVEVAQLNLFIQDLQRKIEENLSQYYEEAKTMFSVHTIKEAKKPLANILEILQLSQFNMKKLKDAQLKNKIQTLKEDIKESQQIIKSQRQKFQQQYIDLFDNFQDLVQLAKNQRLSDKSWKMLAAKLQQEIRLLSGSSQENSTQILFLKKHGILNQLVFIIHAEQVKRQELLQRLNQALKRQKWKVEDKLKKQTETDYVHSYEGLMRACYICEKYSLGDMLQTFRPKRREYLQVLQYQLQSAGLNQNFLLLCSPFWITQKGQIQAQVYNRFVTENIIKQKYFIGIIVSRKITSFIDRIAANRVKKQGSITVNINVFMDFIKSLNQYKDKFYNPELYEDIKKDLAQKMQNRNLGTVQQ